MSFRVVLKGSTLALAAMAFFVASDRAAAQYNGGIAFGLSGPTSLGCFGGPAGNQGVGLGVGLGGGGLGGMGSGGGGPGGILGNLAQGLPGQGGNSQMTPGMSPTGRFYNYDLVTASGQLTGPLPIVQQWAGIAGMRTMGMGGMGMRGGMGMMGGGMGMMGGGMGMMGGGMGMGGGMMGGGANGMLTGGMGRMGGNQGYGGSGNQMQNMSLLPPGVQLNQGYNTLIGLPITQSPMGMMMGGGMGMGGMGGMGMGGFGRRGYGGGYGGYGGGMGMGMGKGMMMGNGGYGL